jgi:hypothetical protein
MSTIVLQVLACLVFVAGTINMTGCCKYDCMVHRDTARLVDGCAAYSIVLHLNLYLCFGI